MECVVVGVVAFFTGALLMALGLRAAVDAVIGLVLDRNAEIAALKDQIVDLSRQLDEALARPVADEEDLGALEDLREFIDSETASDEDDEEPPVEEPPVEEPPVEVEEDDSI